MKRFVCVGILLVIWFSFCLAGGHYLGVRTAHVVKPQGSKQIDIWTGEFPGHKQTITVMAIDTKGATSATIWHFGPGHATVRTKDLE
jgi:hypothetical protein